MRTWVKATLGAAALLLLAMFAIGGTGAFYFLRHLQRATVAESASRDRIDAVRARFAPRPPLLDIVDPRRGDIRINRPDQESPVRPTTIHVINWKAETGELMETELPLWLMRFSSVNLLSQLGVTPQKFRLTVEDVEHYGPGVIVDYTRPGEFRLLLWVE